nr:MAG TPA: hypothetical protein [Caudoviricetes sp.]
MCNAKNRIAYRLTKSKRNRPWCYQHQGRLT